MGIDVLAHSAAGSRAERGSPRTIALATVALVLLGCGDSDSGADAIPPLTPPGASVPNTDSPAGSIDFDELVASADELDGRVVTVHARAFFLEQCPPPSTAQTTRCSLSLFVTEPERDHLLYADRNTAVPVFDADGRVTCHVGDGVTTACPGWEHAAEYDLTGTVASVAGDPGVELYITEFTLRR